MHMEYPVYWPIFLTFPALNTLVGCTWLAGLSHDALPGSLLQEFGLNAAVGPLNIGVLASGGSDDGGLGLFSGQGGMTKTVESEVKVRARVRCACKLSTILFPDDCTTPADSTQFHETEARLAHYAIEEMHRRTVVR